MKHFQNKIRLMREAIDTIKLDIETIRTKQGAIPNQNNTFPYNSKPHSTNKTHQIPHRPIYSGYTGLDNELNTNSTIPRVNSPDNEHHPPNNLALSSNRLLNKTKSNHSSVITPNRDDSTKVNRSSNRLHTQLNLRRNLNEIAKVPESLHDHKPNGYNTINGYNYYNNSIKKQPKLPPQRKNDVPHPLRTESNDQTEHKEFSNDLPHPPYTTKPKYTSNTICDEDVSKAKVKEYEKTIDKLIALSNTFLHSKSIEVSYDNLIEHYQTVLTEIKRKDELIAKMYELNALSTGVNISNEKDSFCHLWRWMKALASSSMNNANHRHNEFLKAETGVIKPKNRYEDFCLSIMKHYKLNNINELASFIDSLLKKADKNECFLEGITNILFSH